MLERLVDVCAKEMKMDPAEIRRKNFIQPSQFPYQTPVAVVYDTGNYEASLDKAMQLADYDGFTARAAVSKANGKVRGRGVPDLVVRDPRRGAHVGATERQFHFPPALRGDGQGEIESRAARRIVRGPQAPTLAVEDGAADCEPQAESISLGREKRIEDLLQRFARHARAVVGNHDAGITATRNDAVRGSRVAATSRRS